MAARSSQAKSWTSPALGWFFAALSVLGVFASYQLQASELAVLNDPDTHLACDLNPLLGCSSSLLAPQAHLLGIPNSAVGLFIFGMLLAVSAVLIGGQGLPKLVWWGLSFGSLVGLGYVVYFLIVSIKVFGALCPYCMLVWLALIGLAPAAWGGALRSGAFGASKTRTGTTVLKFAWAISLALILLIVLVILLTLSDKVALLFG